MTKQLLLLLAAHCLLPTAHAQECIPCAGASPLRIDSAAPSLFDCKVKIPNTSGAHDLLSGVAISSEPGTTLVLTAAHGFRDHDPSRPIQVCSPQGCTSATLLHQADERKHEGDLAILRLPVQWHTAPLSRRKLTAGLVTETRGWKFGKHFARLKGRLQCRTDEGDWWTTGLGDSGMSGGGVYDPCGELLGVMWGATNGEIYFSPVDKIDQAMAAAGWTRSDRLDPIPMPDPEPIRNPQSAIPTPQSPVVFPPPPTAHRPPPTTQSQACSVIHLHQAADYAELEAAMNRAAQTLADLELTVAERDRRLEQLADQHAAELDRLAAEYERRIATIAEVPPKTDHDTTPEIFYRIERRSGQ